MAVAVENAIIALLLADSRVSAITTVVKPHTIPQRLSLPAITVRRRDTDTMHTMAGPISLPENICEVDCHATDVPTAKELADAARLALDGFSGTAGTVVVRLCRRLGEGGSSTKHDEGSDTYETVVSQLYGLRAREAARS